MNAIGKTIRLYWRIQIYARLLPYVLAVLIVVTNTACSAVGPVAPPDGQVWELAPGATQYGLMITKDALVAGTVILRKGQLDFYGWPSCWNVGAYCFAVLRNGQPFREALAEFRAATGGKGNLVNTTDFNDLVDFLKSKGWQVVGGSLARLETLATGIMPTFLVLPAGIVPPDGAIGVDG
jgi:hypothetical protein